MGLRPEADRGRSANQDRDRRTRRQRSLGCWERAIEPYIHSSTAPGVLAAVIHNHMKHRMVRLGVQMQDQWFHSDGTVETNNPMFRLATWLVATDATDIPASTEMDRAAEWARDHWDELLHGDYDDWRDETQPWVGETATPVQVRSDHVRERSAIPPDCGKRGFSESQRQDPGRHQRARVLRLDRGESTARAAQGRKDARQTDGATMARTAREGDGQQGAAEARPDWFAGLTDAEVLFAGRQLRIRDFAETVAESVRRECEGESRVSEDERNRRLAQRQQSELHRRRWIRQLQQEADERRHTNKSGPFDATKGFPGEGWEQSTIQGSAILWRNTTSRQANRLGFPAMLMWLGLISIGVFAFRGAVGRTGAYHVQKSEDAEGETPNRFWRQIHKDWNNWPPVWQYVAPILEVTGRVTCAWICVAAVNKWGAGVAAIGVMAVQRRTRWLGLLVCIAIVGLSGVTAGGGDPSSEEDLAPAMMAATELVRGCLQQSAGRRVQTESQGGNVGESQQRDGIERRPHKVCRQSAAAFFATELQDSRNDDDRSDEDAASDSGLSSSNSSFLSSDGESDSAYEDDFSRSGQESDGAVLRTGWQDVDQVEDEMDTGDQPDQGEGLPGTDDRVTAEGNWRSLPCPHGAEGWCWDCPAVRVFSDARALRLANEVDWRRWKSWLEDMGLSSRQLGESLSRRPQLQQWLRRFLVDEGDKGEASRHREREASSEPGKVFRVQHGTNGVAEDQRRRLRATIADAVQRGKTPVYIDGGEVKGVKHTGTLGVFFPSEPGRSVFSRVPMDDWGRETSQRGEIYAILVLLSLRRENESFVIVSDSWNNFQLMTEGLAEWARKGFKKRMRNEAEMFLLSLLRIHGDEHQDEWRWVRSHKGDRGNETADQLCDLAGEAAPSARSLGVDAESLRIIASLVGVHKKREVKVQRGDRACYPALRSVGITRAEWSRYRDAVTASLSSLGNPFLWCNRREGESQVERLDRITNAILDAIWSGQEHVGTYDRWAQGMKDELKDQRRSLEQRKRTLERLAREVQETSADPDHGPIGRQLARSMRENLVRTPGEASRQWTAEQAAEKIKEELALWHEDADHFDEQLIYTVQDKQRRRRYAAFCNKRYKSMMGDVMEVAKGRRCEVPGAVRVHHYTELYEEMDATLCCPKYNIWQRWPVPLPPIPDDKYVVLHRMATPESVQADAAKKKARAAADPDGIAPKHIVHGGHLLQQWVACLLNVWRFESVDQGPTTSRQADLRLIDKGKQGVPLDRLQGGTWREIMYTSIFRRLAGSIFKPMIETLTEIGAWPKEQQGAHGGARINLYKIKWAIRLAHKFQWPLLILFTDEEGAFPHNSATELEHWLRACGFDEQLIRFKVGLQRGIAFRVEVGDREWSRWIQMTRGHIQGLPDSPMDYMGPSAWRLFQLDMHGLGFHVSESIVISGGVYVDDEFQLYGGYNQTAASTLDMARRGAEITNRHYDCARRGVSRDSSKLGIVGIAWQRGSDGKQQYRHPVEWEGQIHLQSAPDAADGTVVQVPVPVLKEHGTYKLLAHQVGVLGIEAESREAERAAIVKVLEALDLLDLPQRASIEVTDWCGQGMAKYHAMTVDPCTVFDKYMDSVMAAHVKKSHRLRPSSSNAQLYARCEHYGLGKESLWALKQWGKVTTLLDLCNDDYMGPLAVYIRDLERTDLGVSRVVDGSSWFFDWDLSDGKLLQHLLTRRGKGKDFEFRGLLRIANEYRGRVTKGKDGKWRFSLRPDSPCATAQTMKGSRSRTKVRLMLRDVFAQTQRQLWASKATNVFRDVRGLHEQLTNAWRKDRTWKSCFSTFAIKATCDNLSTPVWQHRMDKTGTVTAACPVPGCSKPWCDTRHIMNGCDGLRDRHTIYNWRHNIVLEVFRQTVARWKKFDLISFDKAISEDFIPRRLRSDPHDKPDLVLIDRAQKVVWILDVTVAWDASHVEAEIRKNDKYRWMIEPAASHLRRRSDEGDGTAWRIASQGVVVGSLGSIPMATRETVRHVWPEVRQRAVDSLLRDMSKAAIEGSHGVWAIFNATTHHKPGRDLTFDRRQPRKRRR